MTKSLAIRLNKFLAERLGVSRREADDMIAEGRVSVNNTTGKLGDRISATDTVVVAGKIVSFATNFSYIMLNKPVGYVSSRKSQDTAPTLYTLLPDKFKNLKTVGRLDKESSGLIILTDDGDFAYKMTHPRFKKIKRYEVTLDRDLAPLHQQMIADFGVELKDGQSKLLLTRSGDQDRQTWQVEMSEGRNRQIRRTFGALGYTVTKLHRLQFGPYNLGDLPPGEIRIVENLWR